MTAGKRKLLIIDDNALNREMLREILQDRYEILTAENGKVGFEILEQNCKELSAILLDMQMPVCDGPQFLKRIREDMLLSSVPVIVITANDDADAELTCLNLGASDFIRKSVQCGYRQGKNRQCDQAERVGPDPCCRGTRRADRALYGAGFYALCQTAPEGKS